MEPETETGVDLAFGYTGKYTDEDTGYTQHLFRWYDPRTGRWLSEDPIGFAAGDSNLSRYVGNEAVSYVDSMGLFEQGMGYDGYSATATAAMVTQDDDGQSTINRVESILDPETRKKAIHDELADILKKFLGKGGIAYDAAVASAEIGAAVADAFDDLMGITVLQDSKYGDLSIDHIKDVERELNKHNHSLFQDVVDAWDTEHDEWSLAKARDIDMAVGRLKENPDKKVRFRRETDLYDPENVAGDPKSHGNTVLIGALGSIGPTAWRGFVDGLTKVAVGRLAGSLGNIIKKNLPIDDKLANELKNYIIEKIQQDIEDALSPKRKRPHSNQFGK